MTEPSAGRHRIDEIRRAEGERLDAMAPRTAAGAAVLGRAAVLAGVCTLLTHRQRYFGQIGEHGSVYNFQGIEAVDHLDEKLLVAMEALIGPFAEQRPAATQTAVDALRDEFKGVPPLPDNPVAYMILYTTAQEVSILDRMLEKAEDDDSEHLQNAFLTHLHSILTNYFRTRRAPVLRHFSDVAREYTVVARLGCACGKPKQEVVLQSLETQPGGSMVDRLDVRCTSCSARQELRFPLPHFEDLGRMGGRPEGGEAPAK